MIPVCMADRWGIVYELWCSVERELRGWKEQNAGTCLGESTSICILLRPRVFGGGVYYCL